MLSDTSVNTNDFMLDLVAFERWQAEQNREVDDITLIKRKKRLCKIVKKVIENELDEQINGISTMIEPILMVIMAALIGVVVGGTLLPIYSLVNSIG